MIIKSLLLVVAPISLIVLGACAREQNMEPVAMTNSPLPDVRVANADAVAELTNAWCNRAERCNLIGPGKKHADRAACDLEAKRDTTTDFRAAECKGVKKPQLTECANDATRLACSLDRGAVMMITSCKGEELCK